MDDLNEKIQNAYVNSILNEKKSLSVPDKHQLAIAKKTLKMSDAGANIMGGMNKKEAVEFLKKVGYSDKQIKKMSEETIDEKKTDRENMIKYIMKKTHKDYKSSNPKERKVMPPFNLYNKTVLMDLDKSPDKDVQHVFKSLGGKFNEDDESRRPDEELSEASEIEFDDFDEDKKKFITSLVGKGREKNQVYFSGIHGTIVDLTGQHTPSLRLTSKDLKKIASNKDVRWVEVNSIAMGYNVSKES